MRGSVISVVGGVSVSLSVYTSVLVGSGGLVFLSLSLSLSVTIVKVSVLELASSVLLSVVVMIVVIRSPVGNNLIVVMVPLSRDICCRS